jgi:hypothetical protein
MGKLVMALVMDCTNNMESRIYPGTHVVRLEYDGSTEAGYPERWDARMGGEVLLTMVAPGVALSFARGQAYRVTIEEVDSVEG